MWSGEGRGQIPSRGFRNSMQGFGAWGGKQVACRGHGQALALEPAWGKKDFLEEGDKVYHAGYSEEVVLNALGGIHQRALWTSTVTEEGAGLAKVGPEWDVLRGSFFRGSSRWGRWAVMVIGNWSRTAD